MDSQTNTAQDGAAPAAKVPRLEDFVYTLKHPVEVRTASGALVDTVTTITMKRPKAKHLRAMDKSTGEVGKVLALIQSTSGQPASVIDEIDTEDFTELATAVADFFGISLPTG